MEVGVRQAKSELSKLIAAALSGKRVLITNHGRALVELVPARPEPKDSGRGYGLMRGIIERLLRDWDSPEAKARVAAKFKASE
jgi:prevent-host-death family protein